MLGKMALKSEDILAGSHNSKDLFKASGLVLRLGSGGLVGW